jgi:hypothetical protein
MAFAVAVSALKLAVDATAAHTSAAILQSRGRDTGNTLAQI